MKVCAEPGCPELIPRDTRDGRCLQHRRNLDRARGSRQARGYGQSHVRLRDDYQRRMGAGEAFNCWRCGKPIDPTSWHLGHDDRDRNLYRGPECVPCNLATAARRP